MAPIHQEDSDISREQDQPDQLPASLSRGALFWAKAAWVVIAVAILVFLGRSLVLNWSRLNLSLGRIRLSWLIASAVLFVAAYGMSALLYALSLAVFGATPGYAAAFEIVVLSQLAKYLPGGIWAAVGQMELSRRHGVRRSRAVLAIGIMSAAVVLSGLVFGVVAGVPLLALGRERIVAVAVGVAVLAVCMHPAVFTRIVRATFLAARREPPELDVSLADTAKVLLVAFCYWPVAGLGFFLMSGAVTRVTWASAVAFAAAYAVSWTIGYVAIFAPGGLGVREGVMVLMLSNLIGLPAAILVSLAQRVWFTVMELVLAGGWLGARSVLARPGAEREG